MERQSRSLPFLQTLSAAQSYELYNTSPVLTAWERGEDKVVIAGDNITPNIIIVLPAPPYLRSGVHTHNSV